MADIRAILDCYAAARRDEVGVVQGCRIGLHGLVPPRPSHCTTGPQSGLRLRASLSIRRKEWRQAHAGRLRKLTCWWRGVGVGRGVAWRDDTTRHDTTRQGSSSTGLGPKVLSRDLESSLAKGMVGIGYRRPRLGPTPFSSCIPCHPEHLLTGPPRAHLSTPQHDPFPRRPGQAWAGWAGWAPPAGSGPLGARSQNRELRPLMRSEMNRLCSAATCTSRKIFLSVLDAFILGFHNKTNLRSYIFARATPGRGRPRRFAPLQRATRTLLIPICCLTIDEPAQCHASPLLERAPGPYGAHESTPSLADPAPIGARSYQWRAVTRRSSRGLWPLECPACSCSINDGRVRPPYALDRSGLVRAKAIQGVVCVTGSAQIEGTRRSAIGSAGTLRHGSNPHPAPSANPAPRSSLLAPRSAFRIAPRQSPIAVFPHTLVTAMKNPLKSALERLKRPHWARYRPGMGQ